MASTNDRTPRRRPPAPLGPWLNVDDSAEYLGISRATLYRLMRAKVVAFELVGERRRVAIAELDRYARRRPRRAS